MATGDFIDKNKRKDAFGPGSKWGALEKWRDSFLNMKDSDDDMFLTDEDRKRMYSNLLKGIGTQTELATYKTREAGARSGNIPEETIASQERNIGIAGQEKAEEGAYKLEQFQSLYNKDTKKFLENLKLQRYAIDAGLEAQEEAGFNQLLGGLGSAFAMGLMLI